MLTKEQKKFLRGLNKAQARISFKVLRLFLSLNPQHKKECGMQALDTILNYKVNNKPLKEDDKDV